MKVVGALPKEIEFVNEYSAYIPATSAALSRRGRFSLTRPPGLARHFQGRS
jgi:hypothetical protein